VLHDNKLLDAASAAIPIGAFLLFWKQLNGIGLTDNELLSARLLGEIFLSHRHDRHFGITVHHAK
jgi:hypothetical protein